MKIEDHRRKAKKKWKIRHFKYLAEIKRNTLGAAHPKVCNNSFHLDTYLYRYFLGFDEQTQTDNATLS